MRFPQSADWSRCVERIFEAPQEWRLAGRQLLDAFIGVAVALTLSLGLLLYGSGCMVRWSIGRLQALRNPKMMENGQ